MTNFFEYIGAYLSLHPKLGLLFAFVIAFAESLPVIGTVIPGSITMTLIGILVGRGSLPLTLTLLLAFLGAIIGDVLGFWIGVQYKDTIRSTWLIRRYPKLGDILSMGEHFFHRHGGKSIIIGRFIGPTRSSLPLIAGILRMPWPLFLLAAIPSALLWSALYLLPGVLVGAASMTLPKGKAAIFSLIGLAVIVGLWLIFWLFQQCFSFIVKKIDHITEKAWAWLSTHHSSRFIIKLITSKRNPVDYYQLMLLSIAIIGMVSFLILSIAVAQHHYFKGINLAVFSILQAMRTPNADIFFASISLLGNKYLLTGLLLPLIAYLCVKRQWFAFWHLLLLFITTAGIILLVKTTVYSPRPTGFKILKLSTSFPSGHTTLSTALIGFLCFLGIRPLQGIYRATIVTLGTALILLVGIARIYLGAHWLTDILGGWLIGGTLCTIAIISYRRWSPIFKNASTFRRITVTLLAGLWVVFAYYFVGQTCRAYQPFHVHQTLQKATWWHSQAGVHLPLFRRNRLGHPSDPLNIQWLGNVLLIKQQLEKNQWSSVEQQLSLTALINRVISSNPSAHISLLTKLYHDQAPVLFMIKKIPDKDTIIELRLWRSDTEIKDPQADDAANTLLIGTIHWRDPRPQGLLHFKQTLPISFRKQGGIKVLEKSFLCKYMVKTVVVPRNKIPKKVRAPHWNNTITRIITAHTNCGGTR